MTSDVFTQARSFLIRGLAVVVVVLTYVWGSLTASVLSVPGVTGLLSAAGISSFVLTATPADAYYRRRRRRRRWRGGRWWWDPWDD